jgi:flagellar motor protein MotB
MAKEKGSRPRRRSRLVRDLRRPDGAAGRVLRDAGARRRPRIKRSCRSSRLDARRVRLADRHRYPASSRSTACRRGRKLKNADKITPEDSSATPSPDEKSRNSNYGARLDNEAHFALASASLRQAMQDMPEIAEISKHIMIEETKQGLNIEIMDQNGSSMFPEGSKEPYERTRRLVQRLRGRSRRCRTASRSSGHTAATKQAGPGYGPWELSADRANAIRKIWKRRACRPRTSSWSPAAPTPSRCFRTIRSSRPTAASRSP